MRGTPLLRLALMAISLALAGVPIWLLIRSEESSVPVAPVVPSRSVERELMLEIDTAPPAQSIGASYLGRELIQQTDEGGTYSGTIILPAISAADLVVTATWIGTQAAALRVRASNDDGPVAEASFWGNNKVQEVFTIPGAQQ
jgi:hypothetical protein